MGTQFRNLDVAILSQPMPPEFRDTKATVLCNDCSGKCVVPYHWLGLKCSICQSYNTVELQIHGQGTQELQTAAERADATASVQQSAEIQRSAITPPATSSRAENWISNRRRHSSLGIELQHRASDRFARSFSPLESSADSHLAQIAADIDSDDDILGFWRGNRSQQDETGDEGEDGLSVDSDSDQDSDLDIGVDEDDDDDDDDDDDEDDILLIGHR
ncbi:hypothetical protein ED733_001556 [Metarhizium rileyi]|uniref:RCHY1 zinc-ribbon domain-containing protein n=1 Tax=Metarhizium rileyi (strain RCEF 4871) TaxID=1649241 RepID=A0A5C6G196_METRR|nr:hypothetical protein ED733_001556 [Metarhizium rileyi]